MSRLARWVRWRRLRFCRITYVYMYIYMNCDGCQWRWTSTSQWPSGQQLEECVKASSLVVKYCRRGRYLERRKRERQRTAGSLNIYFGSDLELVRGEGLCPKIFAYFWPDIVSWSWTNTGGIVIAISEFSNDAICTSLWTSTGCPRKLMHMKPWREKICVSSKKCVHVCWCKRHENLNRFRDIRHFVKIVKKCHYYISIFLHASQIDWYGREMLAAVEREDVDEYCVEEALLLRLESVSI